MASRLRITLQKVAEHRRNARMTRAELEASKLIKFRALARYVNERSRYYAGIIRERGIDLGRG